MNLAKNLLKSKFRKAWADCAPTIRRNFGEEEYVRLRSLFWEKFEEMWTDAPER